MSWGRWTRWVGRFVFLSVGLGALRMCAPVLVEPTQEDVMRARRWWQDVDSLQLATGRKLYMQKCSGCHSLYPPHRFTPEQWKKNIAEYADEAKLTSQEQELILRYVITMSEVDPRERRPTKKTGQKP